MKHSCTPLPVNRRSSPFCGGKPIYIFFLTYLTPRGQSFSSSLFKLVSARTSGEKAITLKRAYLTKRESSYLPSDAFYINCSRTAVVPLYLYVAYTSRDSIVNRKILGTRERNRDNDKSIRSRLLSTSSLIAVVGAQSLSAMVSSAFGYRRVTIVKNALITRAPQSYYRTKGPACRSPTE